MFELADIEELIRRLDPVGVRYHKSRGAEAPRSSLPMSWARRLKRVFQIDIETCECCGGAMKIIASIEDPAVIEKILMHLERRDRASSTPHAPRKGGAVEHRGEGARARILERWTFSPFSPESPAAPHSRPRTTARRCTPARQI